MDTYFVLARLLVLFKYLFGGEDVHVVPLAAEIWLSSFIIHFLNIIKSGIPLLYISEGDRGIWSWASCGCG
jgi:hypothetical protein